MAKGPKATSSSSLLSEAPKSKRCIFCKAVGLPCDYEARQRIIKAAAQKKKHEAEDRGRRGSLSQSSQGSSSSGATASERASRNEVEEAEEEEILIECSNCERKGIECKLTGKYQRVIRTETVKKPLLARIPYAVVKKKPKGPQRKAHESQGLCSSFFFFFFWEISHGSPPFTSDSWIAL